MGVFGWLSRFNPFSSADAEMNQIVINLVTAEVYKRLAIDSCINLIANALTRCEFQTLEKGKSVKKSNYYLWNVAPNQNENATEFRKKLVSKLFRENECLIIQEGEKLYIADSYNKNEFALKETIYSNIQIGDFTFANKSFNESQVYFLKLNHENIMPIINSLYSDYGSLIASARDIYKRSNAKRLVLRGEFFRSQNNETQNKINEFLTAQFKPWLEANNAGAIFQLQNGYELDDMSGAGKSGVNKNDSRDIRNLVDDIFDFVATSFHVPRGMLKGDVVDVSQQTNNFLMFCINPVVELISAEVNKKMYKKDEYLEGNRLKIDTTKIKVTDLNDLATALDKLFAIGAMSINDVITLIGGETIDEDWANKRFVTKNYLAADELSSPKGGEGIA